MAGYDALAQSLVRVDVIRRTQPKFLQEDTSRSFRRDVPFGMAISAILEDYSPDQEETVQVGIECLYPRDAAQDIVRSLRNDLSPHAAKTLRLAVTAHVKEAIESAYSLYREDRLPKPHPISPDLPLINNDVFSYEGKLTDTHRHAIQGLFNSLSLSEREKPSTLPAKEHTD